MSTTTTIRRSVTAVAATGIISVIATSPATADSGSSGDVSVINTETVQVYASASGTPDTKRVYEQLALSGKGTVDLANPIATSGLRNLDGFTGYDVEDGEQIVRASVDGEEKLRSVSDFEGDLPLDVNVRYELDGESVEPGDVVGESGHLTVTYSVENVTGRTQEVSVPDGKGGTVTKSVDVAIPMVGSLTTAAPANFTNVASKQANMAGDGKGGTKLSFTMTLFPPIGSTTATFGYSADVTDGVVPRADISALPVNPLQSPTFASAAESYQGGADTGAKLADGASQIDANLLKLRDGSAELLAGLIKLRDGAGELSEGLNQKAVPGSEKLAAGAEKLSMGLLQLEDGAGQLADGTGRLSDGASRLSDGAGRLDDGAGQLADGAGELSAGTGSAAAGGKKLTDGLAQISGGLTKLGDAKEGLPAAQQGIEQLKAGVDQLLAGFGSAEQADTLLYGLNALEVGLTKLNAGAGQLEGGLQQVGNGLPAAKGGVDQVKAGLDDSLKQGGSLDQLAGGLTAVKSNFCASHQTLSAQCTHTVDQLIAGVGNSRNNLTAASGGLGQVSTGLGDAIAGVQHQLIPGAQQLSGGLSTALDGATQVKGGAGQLQAGTEKVRNGLDTLAVGVTKAVAGVFALSSGAGDAYTGSSTLSAGLDRLDAGAGQLSDGAGQLADGTGTLRAGAGELSDGATKLDDGAGRLAEGSQAAGDGGSKVADGAAELSGGLTDAADGSSLIFGGLVKAANAAPQLPDGAQRLSTEGTKKLVAAGEATAMNYGEMAALMKAGAERADAEDMANGAPTDSIGLTAYSYVLEGEDGEGSRNVTRGLSAAAVFGAAGMLFLLRRRFSL